MQLGIPEMMTLYVNVATCNGNNVQNVNDVSKYGMAMDESYKRCAP